MVISCPIPQFLCRLFPGRGVFTCPIRKSELNFLIKNAAEKNQRIFYTANLTLCWPFTFTPSAGLPFYAVRGF